MAPWVRRTWAPCGQTPVLRQRGRSRQKISALGALCVNAKGRRPRFYFRLHPDQNIDTPRCVHFLRQLTANLKGKVFVLWDRLGAHQSRKVRKFVKRAVRLRLFYFPPYAPELNPVEYGWSYLKTNPLANRPPEDKDQLARQTKQAFCQIRTQTGLLHSFLHHSPLSFFD